MNGGKTTYAHSGSSMKSEAGLSLRDAQRLLEARRILGECCVFGVVFCCWCFMLLWFYDVLCYMHWLCMYIMSLFSLGGDRILLVMLSSIFCWVSCEEVFCPSQKFAWWWGPRGSLGFIKCWRGLVVTACSCWHIGIADSSLGHWLSQEISQKRFWG